MRELIFEGRSDDTFGEYNFTDVDIDNCGSGRPIQCVIDCGDYGRVMVIGQYSTGSNHNGCWMIGLSKVEEYDEFPDFEYEFIQSEEAEYSLSLRIYLPDEPFSTTWYNDSDEVMHDEWN